MIGGVRIDPWGGGVLPEDLGGGLGHTSGTPSPISDQNMSFFLP